MSTTTVSETLSNFVSSFDSSTSVSSLTYDWKVNFNDTLSGVKSNGTIYSNPNTYGNKLTYDGGLNVFGSSIELTDDSNPIYTIPGKTSITCNEVISGLSSYSLKISSFKNPTDVYYRSFDLLETISDRYLNSNYQGDETFIGIEDGNGYELGIAILKAPSKLKIKNKHSYLERILERGAIGTTSYIDLDNECVENLISEDERIITVVLRKDGTYYDNYSTIYDYALNSNSQYNYRYSTSGGLNGLSLTNIGTDGRYISGLTGVVETGTDYVAEKITLSKISNECYYPLKSNHITFNIKEVTSSNLFTVKSCFVSTTSGYFVYFIVSIGDEVYGTSPIKITSTSIYPKISCVDFSSNYSFNISELDIVTSTDTSTYISDNLTKFLEPNYSYEYVESSTTSITTSPYIINSSKSLRVIISNPNTLTSGTSTLSYTVYKDSVSQGTTTSTSSSVNVDISSRGVYKITSYIVSNGTILQSSVVTTEFTVYLQLSDPVIVITNSNVNGNANLITTNLSFTQAQDASIFFTIDGNDVNLDTKNYYICNYHSGYSSFELTSTCTVKALAYLNDNELSNQVSSTATVSKTLTANTPTIQLSVNGDNTLASLISANSDYIFYTDDGTDPTIYGKLYRNSFILNPDDSGYVTIKAYAIRKGAYNSSIFSDTIFLDYYCAPWRNEGEIEPLVSDNQITLYNNSKITRYVTNDEYYMEFEIKSISGIINLLTAPTSTILDKNNYEFSYMTNPNYIISTTYSGEDFTLIHLGHENNKFNKLHYKDYGTIEWNNSDSFVVKYEVIYDSTLNSYRHKITIIIGSTELTSNWNYVVKSGADYQTILLDSPIGVESNVVLGNITFGCY